MPTLSELKLPLPATWQEFEKITRDAYSLKWASPDLQLNGRCGQTQNGVDIFGCDHIGRFSGIQCKLTQKEISIDSILKEIKKAEKFKPKINSLYIATTADRDSKLQEKVRQISEERSKNGEFAVGIIYWDDIVSGLILNNSIFKSHYPNVIFPLGSPLSNQRRMLSSLQYGYYGSGIEEYIELIYGEFGWMAQEDPDQIAVALDLIERGALVVLPEEDASQIRRLVDEIRRSLFPLPEEEIDLRAALKYAKRIVQRVVLKSHMDSEAESKIINFSINLSTIFHSDDDIKKSDKSKIRKQCEEILSDGSKKAIKKLFTKLDKTKSGYLIAPKVYTLVESELRRC